jgi:polar amino acid transport system substrate-binding protein
MKYILLLLSLVLSSYVYSKEVVMAFSLDIPPYIFETKNKGIEIEIITAALAKNGHTLKPLYFPLARIPWSFKNKKVDAAMGDMGIDLKNHQGFSAEPAVIYNNVFISLSV